LVLTPGEGGVSEEAYEIYCPNCRADVPSTAGACPACGEVLLTEERAPARIKAAPAAAPLPAPETPPAAVYAPPRAWSAGLAPSAYAGFWIRVLAQLIDGVLLVGILFVLGRMLGATAALAIWIPLYLLYFPVLESSKSRGTLGKNLFGLAVADLEGRQISFARACVRTLARIPAGILFEVGFLMVAFTKRKQGLHDLIAGTVVVHRFAVTWEPPPQPRTR
jgi:uncharacterized RDD family membrane protein YckC